MIPVHEDINIFTEYFPSQLCLFMQRESSPSVSEPTFSFAAYLTFQLLQICICIKLFKQRKPVAYW